LLLVSWSMSTSLLPLWNPFVNKITHISLFFCLILYNPIYEIHKKVVLNGLCGFIWGSISLLKLLYSSLFLGFQFLHVESHYCPIKYVVSSYDSVMHDIQVSNVLHVMSRDLGD
jgi:hypothetical protein